MPEPGPARGPPVRDNDHHVQGGTDLDRVIRQEDEADAAEIPPCPSHRGPRRYAHSLPRSSPLFPARPWLTPRAEVMDGTASLYFEVSRAGML